MNTNKSNGGYALSYFARLFALDIGCFVMSFFVIAISSNEWLRAFIQLCALALLISVTYSYFYKMGDADAVLVHSGYKAEQPLKGLAIGLIANIPFFMSGALFLLGKFGVVVGNIYNYYKIINSFFFPFLYSVLPVDMSFAELQAFDVIKAIAVLFIIPLLSMFSYLIGLSRFSFREKLFYKKSED